MTHDSASDHMMRMKPTARAFIVCRKCIYTLTLYGKPEGFLEASAVWFPSVLQQMEVTLIPGRLLY